MTTRRRTGTTTTTPDKPRMSWEVVTELTQTKRDTQQEAWDIAAAVLWENVPDAPTTTRAEKMEAAKVIALFALSDWLPK